jgi:hypothetical protein
MRSSLCALALGACVIISSPGFAQEAPRDLVESLERIFKDEALSWEQKNAELRRTMEALAHQMGIDLSSADWNTETTAESFETFDIFDAPVLSKFSGKDGVPFPSEEQLIRKPSEDIAPLVVEMPTPLPAPTARPYQRPRRCERSETKRRVYNTEEREELLLFDYLYIPEDLVPIDPEEVFGKDTRVVSVPAQPDQGTDLRLEIHDVPCLPYRNRKSNTAEYEDRGMNALRNYDGGQATPGKLHPTVQRKLSGQQLLPRAGRR